MPILRRDLDRAVPVTMAKPDGGPAFPRFERERVFAGGADRVGHEEYVAIDGMSLRDYFAAQALHGLMSMRNDGGVRKFFFDEVARQCFLAADAMLLEREKVDGL